MKILVLLAAIMFFSPVFANEPVENTHGVTKLFQHNRTNFYNDQIWFYKHFSNMLESIDVIGSTSTTIKNWLGEPYRFSEKRLKLLKSINVQVPADKSGTSSMYFRVPRESDEPCFHVLRFKLEGDKVVQWSVIYNNVENLPITTNVLLKFDKGGSLLFHEGNGYRYPQTVAKVKPSKESKPNLVDRATRGDGPRDMNMFNIEPTVLDDRFYYAR